MMRSNQISVRPYRVKTILMYLMGIGFSILALKLTAGWASIAFVLIALGLAVSAHRQIHRALFLLLLLTMLTIMTPVLVPKGVTFFVALRMSYVILAVALMAKSVEVPWPAPMKPFWWLVAYLAFEALTSFFGWMPIISELKIGLFSVLLFAGLGAAALSAGGQTHSERIRAGALAIAITIIWGSLAVYPFPSISRFIYVQALSDINIDLNSLDLTSGPALYSGITSQSQTLGPLCAGFSAFLMGDYLFNIRRRSFLYLGLLLAIPVLVYLTSSRTAMGTYLFSIGIVAILAVRSRTVSTTRKHALTFLLFSGVFAFVILFICMPEFSKKTRQFVLKFSEEGTPVTAVDVVSSRQGLAEKAFDNFKDSPLVGNGFQVSRVMSGIKVSTWKQLLSAPVEKGFLPTMVLEEGGVFGASLFLLFVLSICLTALQYRCECFLATFLTMLVSNLGEATFFSISALGGILWILCFTSLTFDFARQRAYMAQALESHGRLVA